MSSSCAISVAGCASSNDPTRLDPLRFGPTNKQKASSSPNLVGRAKGLAGAGRALRSLTAPSVPSFDFGPLGESLIIRDVTDDLGPLPAPGLGLRGSRLTEAYFAVQARSPGEPVLIFHHIQKTAGTALRRLIRSNLKGCEVHQGRVRRLRDRTADELASWYGDWYAGLGFESRARMRCVMGHSANFLLPFVEAPTLTIAIVRDPVDRVISQYYFARANRGKSVEATGVPLESWYKREHPATLGDVYRELGGGTPTDSEVARLYSRFFNGQARSLLHPHWDVDALGYSHGPSADAARWRKRLFAVVDAHYLLGAHERVGSFADTIATRMGWKPTRIAQAKVNAARPLLSELPNGMDARIRAFNWLDEELHRRIAAHEPQEATSRR
jgi:hypothetical protein